MLRSEKTEIYTKDAIIIRENDKTKELYVLTSGHIGIYKNNIKIAEIRESGVIFGEISAILNTPRTTTIRAETDVTAIPIHMEIDELIIKYPGVAKQLMMQLAQRLTDMNEKALGV